MKCVRTTLATLIAITFGALLISTPAGANPAAAGAAAMLVENQSLASGRVQPAHGYGYGYGGYGRGYYGGYGRGYYGGYGRGYYGGYGRSYYGGYGRGYYGGYGRYYGGY